MKFEGLDYVEHPDYRKEESRHNYTCGHCNRPVSGVVVSTYYTGTGGHSIQWILCTNCGSGSVLSDGTLYPGSTFGPVIEGLPQDVLDAYSEARNCYSINAFTATELMCRKILMHVAVEKGAKEKETFEFYLNFLSEQGYITPPMKEWVDLIRQHGGKATHLIEKPARKRAESTLMFTAELLRLIYEMEHLASQYIPKPQSSRRSK